VRRPVIQLFVMSYLVALLPSSQSPAFGGTQDLMPLPKGQVGIAYSAQIKTEGGHAPLAWRLATGELPPGLSVSASGVLEGKPTEAKRDPYTFSLSVSDSSQPAQTAQMEFSIVIQVAAAPSRSGSGQNNPSGGAANGKPKNQ
jgi:Putative Ig domain